MATLRRICTLGTLGTLGACTQLEPIDDGGAGAARIPDEVQRAFDDSCATAGCHDAASRQGGLDLSATAAPTIIGGASTQSELPLVELGNVEGSYLALKLLPEPPAGVRMPVGGDVEGIDNAIILGWIAGATLPGGGVEGTTGGAGETTESTATATRGEDESTGSSMQLCGLDDVAPGVQSPFDIGTAAGQIPPDVGEALSNNCGCHEVDPTDLVMGAFPYTGMLHFSTIAEVQGEYPVGDMTRPVIDALLERLHSDAPNPMPPPYYCDLGDGTVITDDDRQLLVDWLMAGAPDAPSWP